MLSLSIAVDRDIIYVDRNIDSKFILNTLFMALWKEPGLLESPYRKYLVLKVPQRVTAAVYFSFSGLTISKLWALLMLILLQKRVLAIEFLIRFWSGIGRESCGCSHFWLLVHAGTLLTYCFHVCES